jgi:excisionase family DNA binding protein
MLLNTNEVAALLNVHPKHVYRLLKRGLPAHRVGDEWRFDEQEVRRFYRKRAVDSGRSSAPAEVLTPAPAAAAGVAPPLLAANGDVAIEVLLDEVRRRGGPCLGLVPADHSGGLDLLRRAEVLLTGCHGDDFPAELGGVPLARVHVAEREIGLVFRRGLRIRRVSSVVGRRFAGRPPTAGVRAHFDEALRRDGVEPERAYASAQLFDSHRDVVMAVVRGDADIGLASRAWAARGGLGFLVLASEAYGLILRAENLGDPRVVALCEAAQADACRKRLVSGAGYEAQRAGEIRVGAAPRKP